MRISGRRLVLGLLLRLAFSTGFFARAAKVVHLPCHEHNCGNQQDDNLDELQ
jgi:hypothetical protein